MLSELNDTNRWTNLQGKTELLETNFKNNNILGLFRSDFELEAKSSEIKVETGNLQKRMTFFNVRKMSSSKKQQQHNTKFTKPIGNVINQW